MSKSNVIKFLNAIKKQPAVHKQLAQNSSAVLSEFGVTPEQYQTIRDVFAAVGGRRRWPEYPWPPGGTADVIISAVTPPSWKAGQAQKVVLSGRNMPASPAFAVTDPNIGMYNGQVTSSSGTEITGTIVVDQPGDEYVLIVWDADTEKGMGAYGTYQFVTVTA